MINSRFKTLLQPTALKTARSRSQSHSGQRGSRFLKKWCFLLPLMTALTLNWSCTGKKQVDQKVINLSVQAKIKGMDPIFANDLYAGNEVARVYEGLLQYHYLKRPFTLEPNLADGMPTVSEDGLTYTFKIKKGVYFQDDAAFPNGKGRELEAKDFVYSMKRNADPHAMGLGFWVMDGKIKGLNEWRDKNKNTKTTNYDEEVEGLKALDKYTFQVTLARPFPQFLYGLAMPFYSVVPREAVEKYGKEFINHPVGTGPFKIERFNPHASKLVYVKNPTFRKKLFPSDASEEFKKEGFLADAGKELPLVDKLVVHIIPESQPRWLNFQKGKIDFMGIPKDNFDTVVTPSQDLSPEMKKKQITLKITPALDVTYIAFNHTNDLFKNKKLRQAISMAYDTDRANELFYNSTALKAQSVVPPGIAGHIPAFENPYRKHDVAGAKKLLAEAGYPEGKNLPEITFDTIGTTVNRQMGEFLKKNLAEVGVKIRLVTNTWPELQKKIARKMTQLHGIAWGADYPDAENFLQLLYGPNSSPGANGSNYANPEFDQKFLKASMMQDSPERTKLYEELNKFVAEEMPIIFLQHRRNFVLTHKWVKNYVTSDFNHGNAQYYNVDTKVKNELSNLF